MNEKTKKYYLGLLSDNVKDMINTRKSLSRCVDDLTLISNFISNGDIEVYEEYSSTRLSESIDTLAYCLDLLWNVANNVDCCIDYLERKTEGGLNND